MPANLRAGPQQKHAKVWTSYHCWEASVFACVHMFRTCYIKLQSPPFRMHEVSSCQPKGCMDLLRFPRTTLHGAASFLARVSGLNPPAFSTCSQEVICGPQPRIVYGFGWPPSRPLAPASSLAVFLSLTGACRRASHHGHETGVSLTKKDLYCSEAQFNSCRRES